MWIRQTLLTYQPSHKNSNKKKRKIIPVIEDGLISNPTGSDQKFINQIISNTEYEGFIKSNKTQ